MLKERKYDHRNKAIPFVVSCVNKKQLMDYLFRLEEDIKMQ